MSIHKGELQPGSEYLPGDTALVLPLNALDRTLLPVVGGKAANLGELIHAGFSVPAGFCVTTPAYALVSAGLESTLAELAATPLDDVVRQASLAAAARAALLHAPVPANVSAAITAAYQKLFQGEPTPVAVRSSATAEDLPEASFAGQQETYLNIVGIQGVLTAIQHCWASLWTERATSYRHSRGIDPRTVRLAVVVQRMVDAQVAGVLFTANPLTGKRREIVIEANPGLGEAVVSGATNPDYFVVTTTTGEIVEHRLGDKQVVIRAAADGGTEIIKQVAPSATPCLSDVQVRALAELGAQVEARAGSPQDIEWAIDASGHIWLLQARPITTLFPLPVEAPSIDEMPRVYLSFNVQQGTYRPFTPMGISAIRLLASSLATLVGFPPHDPLRGPNFVTESVLRLFFDVTAALRSSFGRALLMMSMSAAEVRAAAIFEQLATDPRFSLLPTPRLPFLRAMARLLVRSRMPWHLLRVLLAPRATRKRIQHLVSTLREAGTVETDADASIRLSTVERLFLEAIPHLLSTASPVMLGGMQTFALAGKLLGDLATEGERQIVLRGLPANPTTEMTLELWALAEQIRSDPATTRLVQDTSPAQLAENYRNDSLPPRFQQGLTNFLAIYGHRSVSELDMGVLRWSEDPTYILGILASLLHLSDPAQAPDAQFWHASQEAEAMVAELTSRAKRKSRLRGLLVGFCLSRARALGGLREMPRFCIALLLARARALLWPVGKALVQAGHLEKAEDIFFLTLPEAHAALAGTDMRAVVGERHTLFEQELARRHIPLVLLSDGTEPTARPQNVTSAHETLHGTPASPGVVTAPARVILDPHTARLAPGEILVAPSTDPGWTPLFLIAGGLVMEMGGAMAHGAIVAREYGIPAVVGVPQAIERISTGKSITVDGTAGTIVIEPGTEEDASGTPV